MDQALAGQAPEAAAADAGLAVDGAGTPAELAAVAVPDRELAGRLGLDHLGFGRHSWAHRRLAAGGSWAGDCRRRPEAGSRSLARGLLLGLAERHAEGPEQLAGLVVVGGRRDDRDVHALRVLDPVSLDLGEDD